jgi:hypothetical protein
MSEDIIFLYANKISIEVNIPDFSGELSPYTIIWVRPLSDNIFEVSLMSKYKGYSIWLMEFQEDKTFKPLCCGLYFTLKEKARITLADKLHCDGPELRKQISKDRIETYLKEVA